MTVSDSQHRAPQDDDSTLLPILTAVTLNASIARAKLFLAAALSALQVTITWLLAPIAALTERPSSRPRILVISMGGIGDHVLVLPSLVALRAKYPSHEIILIVRTYSAGLAKLLNHCVDRELPYHFGVSLPSRIAEPFRALRFVIAHQLNTKPDLAIVMRWDKDNTGAGMIAFFSGAKVRMTYSEKVCAAKSAWNYLYDTLYTHLQTEEESILEAEKLSRLTATLEGIEVPSLAGLLGKPQIGSSKGLRVSIAPFAGHPKREWTLERWAKLLKSINSEFGPAEFSIFCAKSEQSRTEQLAQLSGCRCRVLSGLPFLEVVSAMQTTSFLVGADSGLSHLAGAAGLPVIQLSCHPKGAQASHYNSPVRWAVSSPHTMVVQPPPNKGCEQACLAEVPCCIQNIQVETVVLALRKHLLQINLLCSVGRVAENSIYL